MKFFTSYKIFIALLCCIGCFSLQAQTLISSHEVASHVGETVKVRGKIVNIEEKIRLNGRTIFLDMDVKFSMTAQNPFSIPIFEQDQHKFGNIKKFLKKKVELTGTVILDTNNKHRPTIVLREPNQIEILN